MNEIHAAVEQLRAQGKTEEEITIEFIKQGYSREEAGVYLQAAPTTTAAVAAESDVALSTHATKVRWSTERVVMVTLVTAVFFVILGIVAWFSQYSGGITGLFGGAPYETESELLVGMVGDFEIPDDVGFVYVGRVAFLESVANSTYTNATIDSWFDQVLRYGVQMPKAGSAEIGLDMAASMQTNTMVRGQAHMDVDLEPIVFDAAATMHVSSEGAFVKFDDMPPLYDAASSWLPKQTWLEMESVDVSELEGVFVDTVQDLTGVEAGTTLALFDVVSREILLPPAIHTNKQIPDSFANLLLAAVGGAQTADLHVPTEMQSVLKREMQNHPFITFVGESEYIQGEKGNYYRYEYDVVHSELVAFIESVYNEMVRMEYLPPMNISVPDILTEDYVDTLNEATVLFIKVNQWGLFAGQEIHTFIKPTRATGIFHASLVTDVYLPRSEELAVPTDVHSETIEALIEKQEAQMRSTPNSGGFNIPMMAPQLPILFNDRDRRDMTVQQDMRNLSMQAERFYAENDFSYQGFCQLDPVYTAYEIDRVMQDFPTACGSSDNSYSVVTEIGLGQYYCIDSTGIADTYSYMYTNGATKCPQQNTDILNIDSSY